MSTIEIICTIIGAVAVILGGVWFIIERSRKRGVEMYKMEQLENKLNTMPCSVNTSAIKDVNIKVNDIDNKVNDLRKTENIVSDQGKLLNDILHSLRRNNEILSNISRWVMKMDVDMIEELVIDETTLKYSPRQLTDFGKEIFNSVNGEEFLQKNKEIFFEVIKSRKPLTAFDVEELANWALVIKSDSEIFNEIKNYLYELPTQTRVKDGKEYFYELKLNTVCRVLSIRLRDMYLEEVGLNSQELPPVDEKCYS